MPLVDVAGVVKPPAGAVPAGVVFVIWRGAGQCNGWREYLRLGIRQLA